MQIEWSVQALEDRVAIFDYIWADNHAAASRLDDRIDHEVERLVHFPDMGRTGRAEGTRELIITRSPYIVAYTFTEDSIAILRVLHGAQQWPKSFL
jgi:toxin ParE1/3/4